MQKISLKNQAYNLIKEHIVSCEYAPGSFLIESELIRQIGASRTPIREALNKLEQENLVRILPKRGVQVCEITMSTLNDIYEVRMLMEPYIIRNYAHRLEREALEKERDRIRNSEELYSSSAGYALDNDLHQMLINASQNTYLIGTMKQIFVQNHRLRILSGIKVKSRNDITKNEHIRIFDCLLANDIEGAAEAMRKHLINSRQAAVDAMSASNDMPVSSRYWERQIRQKQKDKMFEKDLDTAETREYNDFK